LLKNKKHPSWKRKAPSKKRLRVFNSKIWAIKIKYNQPPLARDDCDDEVK